MSGQPALTMQRANFQCWNSVVSARVRPCIGKYSVVQLCSVVILLLFDHFCIIATERRLVTYELRQTITPLFLSS